MKNISKQIEKNYGKFRWMNRGSSDVLYNQSTKISKFFMSYPLSFNQLPRFMRGMLKNKNAIHSEMPQ